MNVFRRRHNITGNNGGGQIKRAAKRMADTRKHRPWELNLKRCVFGMSTRASEIEIPAGFCRANNWTVSTMRERWRAKRESCGNARQSVRISWEKFDATFGYLRANKARLPSRMEFALLQSQCKSFFYDRFHKLKSLFYWDYYIKIK